MYEINILENEEFDALPYKHARSSFGMADAATGRAYVRRTGIEALDADTIRHEFDELLQKVSPHEEDGIRYKSGGSLGRILGPVLGGLLAIPTGGLSLLGSGLLAGGIAGGTSAYSRAKKPEKYGENTFGAFLKDAAIGGVSGAGASALGSGIGEGFRAAGPGFFSKLGGALGIGGAAAPSPSFGSQTLTSGATGSASGTPLAAMSLSGGGVGTTTGSAIPGLSSMSTPLSGITPSAFNAAATGAISQGAKKSLGSSLAGFGKSAAKGVGKSLGADTLINSLAPPQSTAITGTGNFGGGNSGNFPGGNSNVLGIFGNQPGATGGQAEFKSPFSQEDFDQGVSRINQQSSRQTGSVFDQFRSAQPGATVQGSSAFANQLGAIEEGNTQNIGSFTQQTNDANQEAYGQYRYDGVKNANGLTDAKMTEYLNLAKQPDDVIRGQFPGMTPQAFRDIFAGIS